ncbi:MAG: sporulation integral membrane protein YtvI [Herbinix sp.]|nr:sporulation integral membrane protein YtvI [Herbinix sp.]
MKSWIEKSYIAKWFITIALITVAVYLSFRFLLPLIFPFLVAYFLAWIIRPVTELLYRRLKIPRIIGGSFALILLVAVFGTAFCMLIKILIEQAIEFVKNVPIYLNMIADKLDAVCQHCDNLVGFDGGTIRNIVDDNIIQTINMVKQNIMPKITHQTISITIKFIGFIGIVFIVFVAAILMVKDYPKFHERYDNNKLYKDIHKVTVKLSEAGIAFLRCQLIIMSIVAIICVLGLYFLKNDYPVLIGLFIALMDALPILGSGMIFIPWAIIMLINGNIYTAAILMTIYLICQMVREILEPKLIGNRIGIKPLFILISMYVGLKLFSIAGFFLGPIGLLIIITIYKVLIEKSDQIDEEKIIIYDED